MSNNSALEDALDHRSVIDLAQSVLDSFYASVLACGRFPPNKPHIEIARTSGPIHYDHDKCAVVLIPYELLDPGRRAGMDRFAAIGTLGLSGRDHYAEIFNNLLVAHELGHWLQCLAQRPLTPWQAEYDANRIMVAFWREHPSGGHTASTELRLANFVVQPSTMPNPLASAPDADPGDYFNTHLAEIEANPASYAAFQKLMVRKAMAELPAPTFCGLVASMWPT
ncbi:hypothetical protein [Asticcacaulis sp. 201]|uniref:hypothetical protein n=1 Tax=Asticcacaulis sp. 201 TaxID=3028787 RepID=UPI002916AD32|nr:hypothetical protein [Asticcacaulis sp. 201]MDV6332629.1 hypothetical protein [Asticcacaulis sp. 201]